ncbi:MAG: hypothetical protein AAF149_20775 [Bacteroidota bacterium]
MKSIITALFSITSLAVVLYTYSVDYSKVLVEELKAFNYIISTQTVGAKYKFTNETNLVETARQIKDMGSNLLKFSMHPRYCTENYDLPKNDNIKSLTDLANMEPSMKTVLNMDFKYYHIWVYGFSQYSPEPEGQKNDTTQIKFIGGYPDKYEKALYHELYDFTKYLLMTYKGSGKTFYLGHWEGDWHLRWDYDRTKPADSATLQGMIKWERIRQKAIDDAKADHQTEGIEVYNYIEVNLVKKSIEQPHSITVTNSIISNVNPDYVSYSSYDATNPYKSEKELNSKLKEALDYIEAKLEPKVSLPKGKRVWIGEYGNPSIKFNDEDQDLRSKWTIKAGLEWGSPFILYWEMYNNEVNQNTKKHVGYWLINNQGKKQKIWHTHNEFYKDARSYLTDYYNKNNAIPDFDEFRQAAVKFPSLKE